VQVIAWRTISEMTCNVSSGTLNLTHSLTADLKPHIVLKFVEFDFVIITWLE